MVDWNDLQYVLALRDGGTMKKAATLLKTDPTTISRHIKALSASFNASLFHLEKSGHWVLTPTGERVVALAETFKDRLDILQSNAASNQEPRTLTITSLEFLLAHYVAPSLGAPIPGYESTRLRLLGSEKRLSLAYGEADIALRFGRPVEGQLIASKVAEIAYGVFAAPGATSRGWIGLHEDLDWTPEMVFGASFFDRPPEIRVSSYAAAREAAKATGMAAIGPCVVMRQGGALLPLPNIPPIVRDVWSVIHETRRFSKQLRATREWLKDAILTNQEHHRRRLDGELAEREPLAKACR